MISSMFLGLSTCADPFYVRTAFLSIYFLSAIDFS